MPPSKAKVGRSKENVPDGEYTIVMALIFLHYSREVQKGSIMIHGSL